MLQMQTDALAVRSTFSGSTSRTRGESYN